jgi:hypothetical protein
MALHRDIHWIGRQWAVTGHGMQLIDQKLQGFFDIEAVRLWDESHIESMRAKEWLNAADFDKGLAVARARYPLAPRSAPASEAVSPPAAEPMVPQPLPPPIAKPAAPKPDASAKPGNPDPAVAVHAPPSPPAAATSVEAAPRKLSWLQIRVDGGAKFVRPWRVWMKRQT